MNVATPPPAPSPRRAALTVIAEVALIVTALVIVARTAVDAMKPPPPPPPPPKVGGMAWTSFANNHSAHFGFTNLTPDVRVACMKGVVTSTQTRVSIESQIICTGEVKPNTTVSVEASWPKGSPEDICYKESSFGKTLDWSKCEFTHQDVPPVVILPGVSSPTPSGSASH